MLRRARIVLRKTSSFSYSSIWTFQALIQFLIVKGSGKDTGHATAKLDAVVSYPPVPVLAFLGGQEFLHWCDTGLIPPLIPPITSLARKALFEAGVLQEQMPNATDLELLILVSLFSTPPCISFSKTVKSNAVGYTGQIWKKIKEVKSNKNINCCIRIGLVAKGGCSGSSPSLLALRRTLAFQYLKGA